jgi:DNA-binding transcriptional ArsR family regulator
MMNEPELPAEVRQLIYSSVPSIDALELLMQVVRQPDVPRSVRELITALRPAGVTEPVVRESLALLRIQGILSETPEGRILYRPDSPALERAIGLLLRAYNERPVTLIRTVYAIADAKKIQAFADAFKIKKDE